MTEKKDDKSSELIVVRELPQQPMREVIDEAGKKFEIKTIEETMSEILTILRKLEKSIG